MRYSDFNHFELTALQRILIGALKVWDWESSTLYGIEKSELEKIIEDWPHSLASSEYTAALALLSVCGLTLEWHLPDESGYLELCGATRAEVSAIFQRIEPRLQAIIDSHPVD